MIINLSDYRRDHECHCSQYLCPRCNPLRTEAEVVQLRKVEMPSDVEDGGTAA